MPKTIIVDGVNLEMTDTAAQVVQRALDTAQKAIDDFKKKSEMTAEELAAEKKKQGDSVAVIATKDAEIITLKAQIKDKDLTPQKLDQLVRDRAEVIGKAKAVIGDKLVIDGKTDGEIKRQVVAVRVGDAVATAFTDDQVTASFAVIVADVKAPTGQGVRDIANAFSAPAKVSDEAEKAKAYDQYCSDISNAWKKPAAVA